MPVSELASCSAVCAGSGSTDLTCVQGQIWLHPGGDGIMLDVARVKATILQGQGRGLGCARR